MDASFRWESAPLSAWYWPVGTGVVYVATVLWMRPAALKEAARLKEMDAKYKEWSDKYGPSAPAHAQNGSTNALGDGVAKEGAVLASPPAPPAPPQSRDLPWQKRMRQLLGYHNLVLCAMSLVMFVGCAIEVVRRRRAAFELAESLSANARGLIWADRSPGADWLLCEYEPAHPYFASAPASAAGTFSDEAGRSVEATGALYFWSYLYYLSKYYELLDTILELVKGGAPRHFALHVFHHSVVLTMSWLWLQQRQSMQWIGLLFNTGVHVPMYYYYFLTSRGIRPKWKNFITQFQIIQFITSLLCFLGFLWLSFGHQLLAAVPAASVLGSLFAAVGLGSTGRVPAGCAGPWAVAFNLFFNVTLLFSFVNVLRINSSTDKADKAPKKEQ